MTHPNPMSIKEDLEKELEDFVLAHRTELFIDVALWAARWALKRAREDMAYAGDVATLHKMEAELQ